VSTVFANLKIDQKKKKKKKSPPLTWFKSSKLIFFGFRPQIIILRSTKWVSLRLNFFIYFYFVFINKRKKMFGLSDDEPWYHKFGPWSNKSTIVNHTNQGHWVLYCGRKHCPHDQRSVADKNKKACPTKYYWPCSTTGHNWMVNF